MASPAIVTRGNTSAATRADRAAQFEVVLLRLGDWTGALPVACVERVLPAVAIHAPGRITDNLLGHVNVHGAIVPVADLRALLGLGRRSIGLADHFVLVTTDAGPVIAPVDEVLGVSVARADASDARPLRPVRVEGAADPVVTLIDPDDVFGAVALRTVEAKPGR